jgi:hypothetical protein
MLVTERDGACGSAPPKLLPEPPAMRRPLQNADAHFLTTFDHASLLNERGELFARAARSAPSAVTRQPLPNATDFAIADAAG